MITASEFPCKQILLQTATQSNLTNALLFECIQQFFSDDVWDRLVHTDISSALKYGEKVHTDISSSSLSFSASGCALKLGKQLDPDGNLVKKKKKTISILIIIKSSRRCYEPLQKCLRWSSAARELLKVSPSLEAGLAGQLCPWKGVHFIIKISRWISYW